MVDLLGFWIIAFSLCFVLNSFEFIRKFWKWFATKTDSYAFFKGTFASQILAGLSFLSCLFGFLVAYIGHVGMVHLSILCVFYYAGILVCFIGMFIGAFSILTTTLIGLKVLKSPFPLKED